MAEFSAEAYKQVLAASADLLSCEKIPVPKDYNKKDFIFISYSHKDYRQVYAELADLHESGIPFWYDEGLIAGINWDDEVRKRMNDPRCRGVIFFMSDNLFLSQSIQTEIRIVLGEDGTDSEIHAPMRKLDYFSVNLTEDLPSSILKRNFSRKSFEGSEDEMASLADWNNTLRRAFPDKATFLPIGQAQHKDKLIEQIGLRFSISPNYDPYEFQGATFVSGHGLIQFPNGSQYEGDFRDNKLHGEGTLTYSDGSVYQGGFVQGKRSGNGKLRNVNGTLYTGQWLEDDWNGYGKVILPGQHTYEGQWRNGMYHGKGRYCWPDGTVYDGDWVDNSMCGKGRYVWSNGAVYEGAFVNSKRYGKGRFSWPDGAVYEGDWVDDKRDGKGSFRWPDGSVYTGDWVNGKCCGNGILRYSNGDIQEGEWKDNICIRCTYTYISDGHKYIGGWGENGSCGQGTYLYPDGASRSGIWDGTNLIEGNGVLRYADGSEYNGGIRNNLRHGQGVYTLADRTVQSGMFEADRFLG